MEQTDWHDIEEHKFARDVAGALEGVVRSNGVKALIDVAPARTLADLRRAFHDDVKKKIIAEIDKDLTKLRFTRSRNTCSADRSVRASIAQAVSARNGGDSRAAAVRDVPVADFSLSPKSIRHAQNII
jgi:protein required for attachment to host cells